MPYLINAPILTAYGDYSFTKISAHEATGILKKGFVSAIGHQATADILTRILGIDVPMNRASIEMDCGDIAVVFRLLQRLPEGTVLNQKELEKLPYEMGLLYRSF